jgi:hypothetical protein
VLSLASIGAAACGSDDPVTAPADSIESEPGAPEAPTSPPASEPGATAIPSSSVATAGSTTDAPGPTAPESTAPDPAGQPPIASTGGASTGAGSCTATLTGGIEASWKGVSGPGSVTSSYWMTEDQRAAYEATLGGAPQPLVLNCWSADQGHLVTLSASDETAMPFEPGTYVVGAVASTPDVLWITPADDETVIAEITSFDENGIAGTVAFEDPSVGGERVRVELEFDLPRS